MIDSACGHITFIPSDACAATYKWNFGDGDSSSLREPKHTYSDTGLYTITLTINGTTVKQKTKFIGIQSKIQGTDTACIFDGNPISYSIANRDDEVSYTWGVINGTPTIDPYNNLLVQWNAGAGLVTLNMSNPNNGCISTDTLRIIPSFLDSNSIWADTTVCFSGSPLNISGNATSSTVGTVKYKWEFSKDGQAWDTTSSADTLQNLSSIWQDTILLYRRIAYSGNCQFMSNWISIDPLIIKRQPQNCVACLGGIRSFSIDIETAPGITITPIWNYQLKGTSQWSAQFDTGDSILDWPTTIVYDSAKYRCSFSTPCGTVVSDVAYVLIEKAPSIISHPQSQTKAVGDSVIFTATDSSIRPYYTWYVLRNGAQGWDSIPGEHNDTLIIRNLTFCDNYNRYRVVPNICNNETSNSAMLTVTSPTDLWSKDGVGDVGIEPNTATANDYWASPDLWNCWPNGNCNTHRSPEFANNEWNYLRTTVRNKGTSASGAFNVKTYWTLGGFYEKWPLSWHYDLINNGFYNTETDSIYPMGGEIGTVSSAGISANNEIIATFQWAPPSPNLYNTSPYFGTSRISHPLCLLSRIESCPEPPFGMTFPELEPTGHNVINNNNIVTRNTEVYDSIGTNKKNSGMGVAYGQPMDRRT